MLFCRHLVPPNKPATNFTLTSTNTQTQQNEQLNSHFGFFNQKGGFWETKVTLTIVGNEGPIRELSI